MLLREMPTASPTGQHGSDPPGASSPGHRPRWARKFWVFAPVALAVVLPVVLFFYAELGQARLQDASAELTASQWRQATLEEFLRSILDAEAAQRGFLLTEDKSYLTPYDPSVRRVPVLLDRLEASYREIGSQQGLAAIRELRLKSGMKIGELNSSLRLYGQFGRPAAVALVYTDLGKKTIEDIRARRERTAGTGGTIARGHQRGLVARDPRHEDSDWSGDAAGHCLPDSFRDIAGAKRAPSGSRGRGAGRAESGVGSGGERAHQEPLGAVEPSAERTRSREVRTGEGIA